MGLPQVMSGVRQPRRLGRWAAVGAIAAIGVTWLAWDTSSDDHPSIDGTTYDRPGRLTMVFVKRDGRWLARHTHLSLVPNPRRTTGTETP